MQNNIIWITGAKGNMGQALKRTLKSLGNTVLVSDLDVDVTDLEAVRNYANMNSVDYIINCAAVTDVEACEKDMVNAYKVNAIGARNLSIAARQVNAVMIQLSTDDVFSGNKAGMQTEYDNPDPISIYGKSKLAGERYVESLNPKHIIVRSSWVYGYREDDFESLILRKAENQEPIEMPEDFIGSPTSADVLAQFIAQLINLEEYGTFHAACEGSCSRYEFAKAILKYAGKEDYEVKAIQCPDDLNYKRPRNIVLENLMIKMTGIFEMPQWEEALKTFLQKK